MSIGKKRLLVYGVMALSLIAAVNFIKDIRRLRRVDERLTNAQAELGREKTKQLELKRSLTAVEDGFWLEKQIRNVLKMAKPNEVIVVVPETISYSAAPDGESEPEPEESNLRQWLRVFGVD